MPSPTPPIGIRSVDIKDFRRIDSLYLDFRGADEDASDIVVIAGPNGCGKTAVLEACLIALGFEGALQGARGPDATRTGRSSWAVEAEVQTPQGIFRTVADSNGRKKWFDLAKQQQTDAVAIPCLYFSSWRAPKLVGALPITAGKPGNRPKNTEQNRIWRAKQHLIDSKAHRLMSKGTLFEGAEAYEEDLRRLNEVWAAFYPQTGETFVVEPISPDPRDGFDVFLTCRDGRKVPVDALSSGQLELFALFGALMLVKFRDGVLVIDEPELHLDPQWHALMVRAIRRFLPAAQLIVATHSPKVYDSVMSFQRHFLIPESDPRSSAWKTNTEGVPAT
ncbi:MAG: hypothetical protein JWO38_6543 [Gemmataceae bacterium]|nr:hypothetical protein [Gemmataceae bacterium]